MNPTRLHRVSRGYAEGTVNTAVAESVMKLLLGSVVALMLTGTSASLWPTELRTQTWMHTCERPGMYVRAHEAESGLVVCQGIEDAIGFLAPLGLQGPDHLVVELVEQLPPALRADAVGCYIIATRRLMVLVESSFMARRTWFGIPTSRALFRSVVAHEVAHAVAGHALDGKKLVNAGHEYIAYVTMFATMDTATRSAAMKAMPGQGLTFDTEINDMRYAMDPMMFGLEAYRHWTRQADGFAFLKQVLDGEVAVDLSP